MIQYYRSVSGVVSYLVVQNPHLKVYDLSKEAILLLSHWDFYGRAMSALECHDPNSLSNIVNHLSFND